MSETELFALKPWPYGPLLLVAMLLFALASVAFAWRRHARPLAIAAEVLFANGSAMMAAVWAYRWLHVAHLPMRSMFEIFLLMGAAVYPLSAFCRFVLGAALPWSDCLIAIVLAFPAALVDGAGFQASVQHLPPALQHWLFGPHVAVYILSYVVMAMAAFHAAGAILLAPFPGKTQPAIADFDRVSHNLVRLGFPLLTLGLVLGSAWGKLAWGDWWNWDPKEMWSLATWLTFVAYFHFRWMYPRRLAWARSLWIVAGFAAIVLTLLSSILPKLAAAGMHSY